MTENVHGSMKRLNWIRTNLRSSDEVLEFGCGTGAMITLPLAEAGYRVMGVDLDVESIDFGKQLLRERGLDESKLAAIDVSELKDEYFDVIIASEVLEHIPDRELERVLGLLNQKLKPGGRLLVTVPNGYGWFEFENLLWNRLRLGRALQAVRLPGIVARIKRLLGIRPQAVLPNTLSGSPHVQRFTPSSIQSTLERAGFGVVSFDGTVLLAGQFSHIIWDGIGWFSRLNVRLGSRWPKVASGYLVSTVRVE